MFSGSFDSSDGVWQVGPRGQVTPAALEDSQGPALRLGPALSTSPLTCRKPARESGQARAAGSLSSAGIATSQAPGEGLVPASLDLA